jgi:membrane protein required for colicin V production
MIDLSIIIIIGLSILIGVVRGATREVLGIAAWVGAFATVFYGLPILRPLGHHYIHSTMVADFVVGMVLFVLSLTVFILISSTISSRVKGSLLGGLDRSLGLVFGLLRGFLLVCAAYFLAGYFYTAGQWPDIDKHALFTPWFFQRVHDLKSIVPRHYFPQQDHSLSKITPLDAKDFIENSLPSLEDTVKNLSTLRPASPKKEKLEDLIEKNDPETQE